MQIRHGQRVEWFPASATCFSLIRSKLLQTALRTVVSIYSYLSGSLAALASYGSVWSVNSSRCELVAISLFWSLKMDLLASLSQRLHESMDKTYEKSKTKTKTNWNHTVSFTNVFLFHLFPVFIMSAGPYNYSYIFKYIIIGDMGVGKSCLLHQFTEKKCMKLDRLPQTWSLIVGSLPFPLQSWLAVRTLLEWSSERALSKWTSKR